MDDMIVASIGTFISFIISMLSARTALKTENSFFAILALLFIIPAIFCVSKMMKLALI